MAQEEIKIGLTVTDTSGSVNKNKKNVAELKDILTELGRAAAVAGEKIASMEAPKRKAPAQTAAGGQATIAKIKEATGGPEGQEVGRYAAMRAVGGSSAKDFAAQSQGLGGLVRLYATFAANIYAVGAAFNALSSAMDTANMVRGLDQLGASQGRNLGALAKQLTATTQGALSLKESLTAVAQTSASGMTNANILKLGQVATKASQALGVNLPDAVNRLSRGITKLEPELLDELGIFTKIEKATEDYARTVGKTASSLTDFERRQAFANAVLDEGAKKFGDIDIDVNPYAQLAASFKNAVDSGLNLINKVISPLVSLLASSPTALTGVLTAIGGILAKQAVPALGAFRENLAQKAVEKGRRAAALGEEAKNAALANEKKALDLAEARADKELNRTDALIKKSKELQQVRGSAKFGEKTEAILAKAPQELTEKDFKTLEKNYKSLYNLKQTGQAQVLEKITLSLRESQKLEEDFSKKRQEYAKSELQVLNSSGIARQQDIIARKEQAAATSYQIRSMAAENVQVLGVSGAYKQLKEDIKKARDEGKLEATRAQWTKFAGTVGIVTGAVSTAISAFGQYAVIASVAIAAFEGLLRLATNSAKESEAFSKSLDVLESSLENVSRTIDSIYKKPLSEAFSIEAIQARANALLDLSESVQSAAQSYDKLISAQNSFDRRWEGIKDIFNLGAGDELADNISTSIYNALRLVREGPAKEQVKKSLQDILGGNVDLTSINSMRNAIDNLTAPEQADKAKRLAAELVNLSKAQANQAAVLTTLKSNLEQTTKIADEFNNSLKATDNFSKLGNQLLTNARDFSLALKDGTNSLSAMQELVNNTKFISLLPPNVSQEFIELRKQINELKAESDKAEASFEKLNDTIAKNKDIVAKSEQRSKFVQENFAKIAFLGPIATGTASVLEYKFSVDKKDAQQLIKLAELEKANIENRRKSIQQEVELVRKNFEKIDVEIFKAGVKNLELGLRGAFKEASVTAARGYVSIIQAAGGFTASLENELQQREIQIQMSNIEALYQNSINLKRNTAAIELGNLLMQKRDLEAKKLAEASGLNIQFTEEDKKLLEKLEKETIPKAEGLVKFFKSPSIKSFKELESSKNPEDVALAREIGATGFASEAYGKEGSMAKFKAQIKNLKLYEEIVNAAQKETREKSIQFKEQEAINSKQLEQARILENITGIYSENLSNRRLALEISSLENKKQQELLKIEEEIVIATKAIEKAKKEGDKDNILKTAEKTLEEAVGKRFQTNLKYENETFKLNQSNNFARIDGLEKLRQAEVTRQNTVLGFVRAESEARLSVQEQELALLNARGIASEAYNAQVNAEIALRRQELQVAQELKAVEDSIALARADAESKRSKVAVIPTELAGVEMQDPTAIADIANQEEKTVGVLERQRASINEINALKVRGIELSRAAQLETAANNKRLEEQAIATQKLQSISKDLGTVFKDWGKGIGSALEEILKTVQDTANKRIEIDKRYGKERKDLEKGMNEELANIAAEGLSPEALAESRLDTENKYKQKGIELSEKQAKEEKRLELDKNISIVSSVKGMFKEKTGAYKAFAALEKTMAAISLAMKIKDVAMDTWATAKKIFNAKEGMFADAKAAVVKAYNSVPFPFNMIAAGIVAAAVAAIIGKAVGGGRGGGVNVPTAEERQNVQFTGRTYDQKGNIVETGRGVLGDPTKKLESIDNSIGSLEKVNIGILRYYNPFLENLRAIRQNTKGFVTALIRTGLAKTEPGQSSSGALFGLIGGSSRDVLDKVLTIEGSISDIINKTARFYQTTSTRVQEEGDFFGLFGGDDYVEEQKQLLNDSKLAETFSRYIRSVVNTFKTSAEVLGINLQNVAQTLSTGIEGIGTDIDWTTIIGLPKDFALSVYGKTPSEIAEILGSAGADVYASFAEVFAPQFKDFQEAGEDYGQTLRRITGYVMAADAAFQALNVTMPAVPEAVIQSRRAAASQRLETARTTETNFRNTVFDVLKDIAPNTFLGPEQIAAYRRIPGAPELGYSSTPIGDTGQQEEGFFITSAGIDALTSSMRDLTTATAAANAATQITARTISAEDKAALVSLYGTGEDALENFNQAINFVTDNFLTNSDRIVTASTALTDMIRDKPVLGPLFDQINLFGTSVSRGLPSFEDFTDLLASALAASDTPEGRALVKNLTDAAPAISVLIQYFDKFKTTVEDNKIRLGELGQTIDGIVGPDFAVNARRERELTQIRKEYRAGEANILIQQKQAIWAAEDNLDLRKREISIMQASGNEYAALIANRELELASLTTAQRESQRRLYAAQDAAKTRDLEIRLLEAQGNKTEALRMRREKELRALSLSDQRIMRRIWALEDEAQTTKDRVSKEVRLYELLGNTAEATRLSRQLELDAMDASLRPMQRYIWALEDQKAIQDKVTTSLKNTISSLKTSIQTLRDYRMSLLMGSESILTPGEKYGQAKQEFERLKALAMGVATTEAEKQARDDAISKLPNAGNALLEASRTLFASSETYTRDFDLVKSTVEAITNSLESQLSDAERTLREIETSNGYLRSIEESTADTATLLEQLNTAIANSTIARAAASAAGSEAAGGTATTGETNSAIPQLQAQYLLDGLSQSYRDYAMQEFGTGRSLLEVFGTQERRNLNLPDTAEGLRRFIDIHYNMYGRNEQRNNPNPTTATTAADTATTAANTATTASNTATTAATTATTAATTTTNAANTATTAANTATNAANTATNAANTIAVTSAQIATSLTNLANSPTVYNLTQRNLVDVGVQQSDGSFGRFTGPPAPTTNTPQQLDSTIQNITGPIVNELRQLRDEVATLRQEQGEQTGHIISTNYDANNRAADAITAELGNQGTNVTWRMRNQVNFN